MCDRFHKLSCHERAEQLKLSKNRYIEMEILYEGIRPKGAYNGTFYTNNKKYKELYKELG